MMSAMIKTERIYHAAPGSGMRILVDRLWPRGMTKEAAKVDLWLKEIGPSDELRKWFGHDPGKWEEFKKRFFKELDGKAKLVDQLIGKARESDLVFLYAAKDEQHNNAVALKEYIEIKVNKIDSSI